MVARTPVRTPRSAKKKIMNAGAVGSPMALASPGIHKMSLRVRTPGKHNSTSLRSSGSKFSPITKQPKKGASGLESQHVSYRLQNKFDRKTYEQYRKRALQDRKRKGPGQSQEMNTLYRFWSYYLRDKHDVRMYDEFKSYACEDAKASYQYGMQTLFRYFSYGLEKHFDIRRWRDFQELAIADSDAGIWYGLEKVWGFLKFRDATAPWAPLMPEIRKLLKQNSTDDAFKAPIVAVKPLQPHNSTGNLAPAKQPLVKQSSFSNALNPFAACFVPSNTKSPVPTRTSSRTITKIPNTSFSPMQS